VDATIAIPVMGDEPAVLAEVLRLAAERSPGWPIVVVDMSPGDALRAVCDEAAAGRVRYDHFPQSGGVSHSRNRCVALARTRHVVFLDSDAYAEPGWAEALVERVSDERTAVAGARILPAWEREPSRLLRTRVARHWLSLLDLGDEPLEIPMVVGTSYSLDRERVPDPPFDESLGRRPGWPLAMEENRLCVDARERGFRVMYEPRAVVRHRIPADRATWRWMLGRAHAAGREVRAAGQWEQIPLPPYTLADRVFQLAVAPAYLAGRLRPLSERQPS
jgi:glycosyltransferase involved in cell wall biosynthesis